jgi:hypothetical protein
MDAVTITGSSNQLAASSVAEYVRHREYIAKLNAEATCWEDYPDDLKTNSQAAYELFERGITPWHLPFFHEDIQTELYSLHLDGHCEAVMFLASWLLESLPDESSYSKTRSSLEMYRQGWTPYPDAPHWCKYPKQPEFYRKNLNWKMVPYAEDAVRERNAENRTFLLMHQMKRDTSEYWDEKLKKLLSTGENLHDTHSQNYMENKQ